MTKSETPSSRSDTSASDKASVQTRTELVQRVRREIQQGVYETPHRIDVTVRRVLEQFSKDGAL